MSAAIVQFYLPRAVAEALPIEGIADEARGAGLYDATLQYSNTRWRPAETLVTCQMPVAGYLLARLKQLAGDARQSGDDGLTLSAELVLQLCVEAIAHPYSPDAGPASGIRPHKN